MKQPAREEAFAEHRSLLFSLAYRMLGSVADAEDVVQEAWLRWSRAAEAESPRDFLSATVARLCIDHLRSARVRRETYVGSWLPEPLVDVPAEAKDSVARAESLSIAFLHLLERLSAVERAVFLLREVYAYDHAEIARMVGKSEAACRQIAKRARDRIGGGPRRFSASEPEAEEMARRFLEASARPDAAGFLELLDPEVVIWSDSGGKAPAARLPIHGSDRAARFFAGVFRRYTREHLSTVQVNGAPAIVYRPPDGPVRLFAFEIRAGRITAAFVQANPDKLRGLGPAIA